ncbi:hypothetical protein DPMN_028903 [Dreissena polymorpha]|uniref:Uncharacterized protein n=1 Tax=Dreissena polymorpha TaxID=45954 RepID=A0A9D4REZ4_DREPO|nr:hypothetical protein DPMN_028903 [Dreissena polymorpha]
MLTTHNGQKAITKAHHEPVVLRTYALRIIEIHENWAITLCSKTFSQAQFIFSQAQFTFSQAQFTFSQAQFTFSQAQFTKVKLCVASLAPDKPSHRPSLFRSYAMCGQRTTLSAKVKLCVASAQFTKVKLCVASLGATLSAKTSLLIGPLGATLSAKSGTTLSAKVKLCVASEAPDKPSHRPMRERYNGVIMWGVGNSLDRGGGRGEYNVGGGERGYNVGLRGRGL